MPIITPHPGDSGVFLSRPQNPALRVPAGDNYWTYDKYPGYINRGWPAANPPWEDSIMYNCTTHCLGRLYEIVRDSFNTQLDDITFNWIYGHSKDWVNVARAAGWTISNTPVIGGIMCWTARLTQYIGHVAIVERILDDGSIYTSEGHYYTGGGSYSYERRFRGNGSWGYDGTFNGCIVIFDFRSGSGQKTSRHRFRRPFYGGLI